MAVALAWQGQRSVEAAGGGAGRRQLDEPAPGRTSVYADNEAAIGLYRKFGFENEGLFRDYAVRDGQWVDTLSMARLRRR
jgi:putative acetyltransferase